MGDAEGFRHLLRKESAPHVSIKAKPHEQYSITFAMPLSYLQVLGWLVLAAVVYLMLLVKRTSREALPLPPGPNDTWYTPGPR